MGDPSAIKPRSRPSHSEVGAILICARMPAHPSTLSSSPRNPVSDLWFLTSKVRATAFHRPTMAVLPALSIFPLEMEDLEDASEGCSDVQTSSEGSSRVETSPLLFLESLSFSPTGRPRSTHSWLYQPRKIEGEGEGEAS